MTETLLRQVLAPEELARFVQRARLNVYPHTASSVRMMAFLQAASGALGAVLAPIGPELTFLLGFIAAIGVSSVCWITAARGIHQRRLIGIGAVNALAFLVLVVAPALAAEFGALSPVWTLAGSLGMALGSCLFGMVSPGLLPEPVDQDADEPDATVG